MSQSHLLQRVRAEFEEMPGLQLTRRQAERLFDIDPPLCEALLHALVCEGFLRVNPNGTYGRFVEGQERARLRPAKAALGNAPGDRGRLASA